MIVGAGRGERLGGGTPKCLFEIEDVPLLILAAWAFQKADEIGQIVLVVPEGAEESCLEAARRFGLSKVSAAVEGGKERQDSVATGIAALTPDVERVLIHDGARPLVTPELVRCVAAALDDHAAVLAALPVSDTLHIDRDGRAESGPDRRLLTAAQTPQGFHRDQLTQALQKGLLRGMIVTDEIILLRETLGIRAAIVPGEVGNIKITRRDHLEFFAPQLRQRALLVKGSQ